MAVANRHGCITTFITFHKEGGTTFAYQSNMEGEMIKLLGDWAGDTYKRYVDISMDKRYDSMKAFVEALNNLTVE